MNIYVSNLSFAIHDNELSGFFSEFGEVSSAKVIMDKTTSRSRGFGFVEMADDEAAKNAISELDGTTQDGRTIKVREARQKEERERPAYRNNTHSGYNNHRSYNENRY